MNIGPALLLTTIIAALVSPAGGAEPTARWYKGNLHTHSLWSDGDDYPEMIADWYKQQGYNFLAISDHNVLQQGTRWLELRPTTASNGEVLLHGSGVVLEKYLRRFGPKWVEQREQEGRTQVRLKPLAEYRPLFEESGRFLLISSEEISARWKHVKSDGRSDQGGPVHMNVTNPKELLAPQVADNALDLMQRTVDAVLEQRRRTGQPMLVHLNHPNFQWGITAEELMRVRGERFFEVYNGHPGVNNGGDATRLDTDAMWDAILAHRLTDLGLGVMYGTAVDDAHRYHTFGIGVSNAGRGWIMVRARTLSTEAIIDAMEAGDFYASTGVTLATVERAGNTLFVQVQPEPGVTYTTRFIGTRRGFDPATTVLEPPADEPKRRTLPHRRYSHDVGAVLAEVSGATASYTLRGDEIYVRAKIISSKPKANGSVAGEFETAWTQPLVNAAVAPDKR